MANCSHPKTPRAALSRFDSLLSGQRRVLRVFLAAASLVATLGCADADDSLFETRNRSQASTTTQTVQLKLPQGISLSQAGLVATAQVTLADRVKVLSSASPTGYGAAINTGTLTFEAGADSKTGGMFAGGSVLLRDRARVFGDVWAAGAIQKQNQVVIDGAQIHHTPLSLRTLAEFSIHLPPSGADVVLEPDKNRVLEPGSYGKLHIKSRSKVMLLTGGEYYFKSLFLEPDATLFAENSQGPVFVVVSGAVTSGSAFTFRGKIEKGTTQPNLLFSYLGTSDAFIERSFTGTLFAPNAKVLLQVSPVAHKGAFYAKKIAVQPDTSIQVEAFNPGDCRASEFACEIGLGCLDQDASGVLDCEECSEGAGPGCVASPLPPAAARSLSATVRLPKGVGLGNFAVAAEASLELESGATVDVSGDVGPKVLSVADGAATLSAGAEAPALVAVGGATLSGSSRVEGDVLSVVPSTIASGAVVQGQVLSEQPLQPATLHTLSATFSPRHQGDRLVGNAGDRILWPGEYGTVTVEAGAIAYLKSGEYRFERLLIHDTGHLEVSSEAGPVRVLVADQVVLDGSVGSISDRFPELIVAYLGTESTTLAGTFEGTLLAPAADLAIEEGPHRGAFYGHTVTLATGVHVEGASGAAAEGLWPDVSGAPDEIVDRPATHGGLHASTEAPGEVLADAPFKFSIPERIPVQAGNAANYPATLEFEVGGSLVTCHYQGGATVSHPTTVLELARGREYGLTSCDTGYGAGDVVEVSRVRLEVAGDPQALGGLTATTLPVGNSCEGYHPDALSPGQSREMIDAFAWPTPDPNTGHLPTVIERTQDGRPALYYATVYIKSQADLDFIDRSLMHRLDKPLFSTEWPERWLRECGTIPFEADGIGQWIFVVLPGVTYNRLLEAKHSGEFAPEAKDAIPPVLLRDIPTNVQTSEGSLNLEILAESGFQYLGQRSLPSKEAVLNAALGSAGPGVYPSGLVSLISNIFEWIVEAVYDVVNEVIIFMGTLQGAFSGTTAIALEVRVLNTDPRFDLLMRRAWGPNVGHRLAPEGAEVNLRMITQNFFTGFLPVPSHFRGHLDENGLVVLNVAKRDWASPSVFQSICVEYGNHAAKLTSYFVPAQVCDGSFSDVDFGRFTEDRAYVQMNVKNRHLNYFTEMTDAHRYMKEVVGDAPRQAYVTIGTPAWYLGGFQQKAYAPCLGYGDLLPDVILIASIGPSQAIPILNVVLASYLTVLGQTDIVITDEVWSGDYRGLATHEYGHFIACHLARRYGWSELDDLALTVETFQAEQDPDPGEDTRVVNEVFADFFAGQIAGGTDYYPFDGGLGRLASTPPRTLSLFTGMVSAQPPGLDDNQYQRTDGDAAIGRLATLLQDAFDGHPKGSLAPSSGDAWEIVGPAPPGSPSPIVIGASARTNGDTDFEQVALGGADIGRFFHLNNRDDIKAEVYREATVERALAALLDERTTWCQKCLVMGPHLVPTGVTPPTTAGGIIDLCVNEAAVAEKVGLPPSRVQQRDAATCEPCPQGQGMGPSGMCENCPADVSLTWGVDVGGSCESDEVIDQALVPPDPNDSCPDTFVVELDNSVSATPATLARIGGSPDYEDGECFLTRVSGTAQYGTGTPAPVLSWGSDETGDLNLECQWPDPSANLSVPADHLRFVVDLRTAGIVSRREATITLENWNASCGPVVK